MINVRTTTPKGTQAGRSEGKCWSRSIIHRIASVHANSVNIGHCLSIPGPPIRRYLCSPGSVSCIHLLIDLKLAAKKIVSIVRVKPKATRYALKRCGSEEKINNAPLAPVKIDVTVQRRLS